MNKPSPTYRIFPLGDAALTIDFGNSIDEMVNKEVIARFNQLHKAPLPGMVEAVPAYSSLTIYYDVLLVKKIAGNISTALQWMQQQLEQKLKEPVYYNENPQRKIEIPVCYQAAFAPDIQSLATAKNSTIEEVIALHTANTYQVYMIGFLPGFPYLGSTDEKIAMPRKDKPQQVVAGSVGIAGRQTGIYPSNSPGGWHIIGRTPLQLFDAGKNEPSFLRMGDSIRFSSISVNDFYAIQQSEAEKKKEEQRNG